MKDYMVIPKPIKIEYNNGECIISNAKIVKTTDKAFSSEEYKLILTENQIEMIASAHQGFLYAEVTLKQLSFLNDTVRCGVIYDKPKYPYRSFMLDCCRHFFEIKDIKKYIDIMALLKMNIFHWHLTEDQAFRIQIDKYPLLHEIGSYRSNTRGDKKPVSGYYTKEQIRELIKYAKERGIDIVPEINVPGHFTSWISAYPELSCREEKVDVINFFGVFPHIACAGKESTYNFIYDVLIEIFELFPFSYIHLGGDEAIKTYWMQCPLCQAKIKEQNLSNEEELQGYFTSRIVEFCRKHGKTVIGWNDGALGGNLPNDMVIQYWQEGKVCRDACIQEVNKGKKLIVSPFFSFYLDYPYGMTPLSKTYSYDERMPEVKDHSNILGVETPLWAEYVDNTKHLEYMVFPRMIAVAEIGWTEYAKRDFIDFIERLDVFYKILDSFNISYASIKESLPGKLKGKWKVFKFYANAARYTFIRQQKILFEYRRVYKEKYGVKPKH